MPNMGGGRDEQQNCAPKFNSRRRIPKHWSIYSENFVFLNTPSFIYGVLQIGVLPGAPSGDLVFY
jgi:hypothetical protein